LASATTRIRKSSSPPSAWRFFRGRFRARGVPDDFFLEVFEPAASVKIFSRKVSSPRHPRRLFPGSFRARRQREDFFAEGFEPAAFRWPCCDFSL